MITKKLLYIFGIGMMFSTPSAYSIKFTPRQMQIFGISQIVTGCIVICTVPCACRHLGVMIDQYKRAQKAKSTEHALLYVIGDSIQALSALGLGSFLIIAGLIRYENSQEQLLECL